MPNVAPDPKAVPIAARLTDKTAIITGAASGMGKAAVERFLAEGANVVAVDLNGDAIAALQVEHSSDGLVTAVIDVTDGGAVQHVVDTTIERFGALDVYFNNAGIPLEARPVEQVDEATWHRVIDVNLTAIYLAARAFVPPMRANGGGSVIVTASASGIRPRPNLSAYSAAKGGAVVLAKALAIELAPDNIRVNALCPLAADTPMLGQFGYGSHDEAYATFAATSPLGRLVTAHEVAAAAAYLASDEAAFMTGLALPIDGGRTI